MLNIIWPIFILISYGYAIFSGNLEQINKELFDSTSSAVELSLTLLGTICLWNGVMEIASKTTVVDKLTKLLNPILKILFPKMKKGSKAHKEISMNMVANILGLGNAATPLGLKAMQTMQKENPKKTELTDNMAMFIILNTASLQLIPTTVIAIRSSLGSQNPTQIMFPVWFATICAAIVGIIATKICIKYSNNKKFK